MGIYRRFLTIVTLFATPTFAVIGWKSLAKSAATEGVDFVYFDRESQDEIIVPFGALGSCKQGGLSIFALDGVVISDVRADGADVERLQISNIYAHPAHRIVVKHPGQNFTFRMNLADLSSMNQGMTEGTTFKVAKGNLPGRVEITYRIRCADGTLAGPFRTIGEKYTLPSAASGVAPSK